MKKKIFFLMFLLFFNSCNTTIDEKQKNHDEEKNVILKEKELALEKSKLFLKKLNIKLDNNYSLEKITDKNMENIPEILIETEKFQLYLNGKNFKIRNFILNDFKVTDNTSNLKISELEKTSNELITKFNLHDEVENFKDYKLDNLYIQNGICYSIYTKGESLLILGFNPITDEIVLLTIR